MDPALQEKLVRVLEAMDDQEAVQLFLTDPDFRAEVFEAMKELEAQERFLSNVLAETEAREESDSR